ncbi:hypothetical protein PPL_12330 [Heterostelium album PN500]|uniref:GRAM domain-containing protein n=1 Tax=Heterostelium pallidum (strain ATCC 26659 / Pp 5 / PN500) TaxID=670386 RepID=D3BMB9_HETP5|nr:hypothetical protein PPL_12330 [Heterostelium album PN500]EFA77720.1 hypothetical protein PPL_12330 [Heterostelium album PN500]|eukprot:XP_020429848.1 hypothetical protein PPL_12330 [Heterostelium album PN500]
MSDNKSVSSASSNSSKKSSSKSKGHQRNISVDKEKQTSQENEKLHKKFNLDPAEVVVTTMKCSHKGRSGKLYVTESHLCFVSKIVIKMSEKKKIVAFSDVLDIEHDKNKQIVKLVKRNGKAMPLHFKESESAFLLIEGQWEASGNQSNSRLSFSIDSNNSNNLTASGNHFTAAHVKHFNLPETETLIKEYRCAQKGAFNHFGKLYLSQSYICFYSALTSGHQKTRIKLRDVIQISMPEKSKNSIQIDTKTEKYVYTKFNDKRESVYELLSKQYEIAKVAPASQSNTPQQSRSRSNSIDQSLGAAPKGHFRKVSSNSSLDTNNSSGVTITPIGAGAGESSEIKPNSRRNSIQITTTTPTNTTTTTPSVSPQQKSSATNTTPSSQTKIAQRLDKIENMINNDKDEYLSSFHNKLKHSGGYDDDKSMNLNLPTKNIGIIGITGNSITNMSGGSSQQRNSPFINSINKNISSNNNSTFEKNNNNNLSISDTDSIDSNISISELKQDTDNIHYNPKLSLRDYIELLLIFGDDSTQLYHIQRVLGKRIGKIDLYPNSPIQFGFRPSSNLLIISLMYLQFTKAIAIFFLYNCLGLGIMLFLGYWSFYLRDTNIPHWIKGIESGFSSAGVGFLILSIFDMLKSHNGLPLVFKSFYTKSIFLFVCSLSLYYNNWLLLLALVLIGSLFIISIHFLLIKVTPRLKYFNIHHNVDVVDSKDCINNEYNNYTSIKNGCGVSKSQSAICFLIYILFLFTIQICGIVYPNSLVAQLAKTFFIIGSVMIGGGGYFVLPLTLSSIREFIRIEEFFKGYTIVQVLPGSIMNFSAFLGSSTFNIEVGLLLWFW